MHWIHQFTCITFHFLISLTVQEILQDEHVVHIWINASTREPKLSVDRHSPRCLHSPIIARFSNSLASGCRLGSIRLCQLKKCLNKHKVSDGNIQGGITVIDIRRETCTCRANLDGLGALNPILWSRIMTPMHLKDLSRRLYCQKAHGCRSSCLVDGRRQLSGANTTKRPDGAVSSPKRINIRIRHAGPV